LQEIPEEVLPETAFQAQLEDVCSFPTRSSTLLNNNDAGEDTEIVVGDEVRHPVFGDGYVERIQGTGANARIIVEFTETGEQRTLLMAYSMLEKLS
jgi:DNA helicase-2/ATP-dependent DNA helicase PcrA